MRKIVKIVVLFIFTFIFFGCSYYTYDDVIEEGEQEYERGYEDGYQEAFYDNVRLIDVVIELLANEEFDAIDSIREIYTDEGVFGKYVIDISTDTIHSTLCPCFQEIAYENMEIYGNLEYALENGYNACEICIY